MTNLDQLNLTIKLSPKNPTHIWTSWSLASIDGRCNCGNKQLNCRRFAITNFR